MTIALIATKDKHTLLLNFAKAYHSALSKYKIVSTDYTASLIEKNCPIQVEKLTALQSDSIQLISPKIANNEINMLIFFKGVSSDEKVDNGILTLCDRYNIPYATNSATAEILIKSVIY